jgi:hypothetical protein
MRAPDTSSTRLLRAPDICMRAVVGSEYGATTVAAESLIAQLHSQSKLTTLSHEKRKIRHEIEILKQMNRLRMCRNFRSID